jgi:catechol 2,3-dioxygenase-like lactoylglutathione lyase family enzyme
MTLSRLHQVALHVDDMERAVAFYRDIIGVRLIARFDPPGLAFFDLGNTRLLLEAAAPASLLYLEVDDIGREHARLVAAGVELVDDPHLVFHDVAGTFGPAGTAEWMTFCRDSEGNLLALVERRPG